jgi:hypothetical protein
MHDHISLSLSLSSFRISGEVMDDCGVLEWNTARARARASIASWNALSQEHMYRAHMEKLKAVSVAGRVSKEDFVELLSIQSTYIESDDYFYDLITANWRVGQQQQQQAAQGIGQKVNSVSCRTLSFSRSSLPLASAIPPAFHHCVYFASISRVASFVLGFIHMRRFAPIQCWFVRCEASNEMRCRPASDQSKEGRESFVGACRRLNTTAADGHGSEARLPAERDCEWAERSIGEQSR